MKKKKNNLSEITPSDKDIINLEKELSGLEHGEKATYPTRRIVGLKLVTDNNWGSFFTDESGELYRLVWSMNKQKPVLEKISD